MRTLLLLVDDDYVDTLKQTLPDDKAWVLPPRFDTFRCQVRQALSAYREAAEESIPYHDAAAELDRWLTEQPA